MSRRSRVLVQYPRGDRRSTEGRLIRSFLTVRVSYSEGGMSYTNYKVQPRGYSLSVAPEDEEEGHTPGVTLVISAASSGTRMFIQEAKRFSQKTLDSFTLEGLADDIAKLRDHVLSRMPSPEMMQP
jgi:hypothetical protein